MNARCKSRCSNLPVCKASAPTEMSNGSSITARSFSEYASSGNRRLSLKPDGPGVRFPGNNCATGVLPKGSKTPPNGHVDKAIGTEVPLRGPNWICTRPSKCDLPRAGPPVSGALRVNKSPKELAAVKSVNSCNVLNGMLGLSVSGCGCCDLLVVRARCG